MNGNLPLVSFVTPVHNGAQFIEDLILSVKEQSYPNIEHIVVDDGSNDNGLTVGILKRYPHLRWWSRPNRGQYATMNEGLSSAIGDVICFVCADDVICPGAVKAAVDLLLSDPELDGAFGATGYMDVYGDRLVTPVLFPNAPLCFVKYLAHVPHCSFYVKRSSLEKHGLFFDSSLSYVGDYEWMIRIEKNSLNIGHMRNELSLVRIHPLQATQVHSSTSLQEIQGVYKKHRVNTVIRRLVRLIHFFYFRWWQMGQEYKKGGVGALVSLVKNLFRKFGRE